MGVSERTMADKRATPARRTEDTVNFMVVIGESGCCVYELSWDVKGELVRVCKARGDRTGPKSRRLCMDTVIAYASGTRAGYCQGGLLLGPFTKRLVGMIRCRMHNAIFGSGLSETVRPPVEGVGD